MAHFFYFYAINFHLFKTQHMYAKTLGQFIIEKQNDFPFAKGELSRLLRDIAIAAKISTMGKKME